MPVKIIQKLRLLNPTLPITRFSIMKTNSTLKPSRVIPIFSRVFPHKLKYQSLSKSLGFSTLISHKESQFGNVRSFSTRGFGSDVKASKSLIEDEAELSDWVSDLRSDSFLGNKTKKLYSDSDDNGDFGRGRKGDLPGKRRREGDSDDFGSRRGGFSRNWDSFDSNSRDLRGKGRSGGDFERKREYGSNDYGMSSRERGGGSSSRGRGGSMNGGRGSRDFDSDDYGRGGLSNRGRGSGGRGSRDFESGDYGRGGVSNRGRGSRDFESDDYGRGGSSKRGRGGRRDSFDLASRDSKGKGTFGGEMERRNENFMSQGGRSSKIGSRGGRGSELGSRGDRGGGRGGMRTGSTVSKRGLMVSDTDDIDDEDEDEDEDEGVKKVRDSFRELISEEDSEDDSESVDDDEDDDEVSKDASSFPRMEIKDSPTASPTSSQGGSDSYLSETR